MHSLKNFNSFSCLTYPQMSELASELIGTQNLWSGTEPV